MKKLILTACTMLTMLTQAQLTSSLVICMPMDNNATDFSGNGNNGTLNGVVTPTVGHTGLANTAYNFNNSFIEVPGSASINNIDLTSELSVSVWCKINGWAPSPGLNFPVIEHYKSVGDDGWQWNLFNTAATGVSDGFAYSLAGLGVFNSNPPYTANGWNHFVLVYSLSANTCKYYINGSLVYTSSTALTALLNANNGPLRIGFSQAGNDEKAIGDMDNLRVYNRVLTQSDINLLFADQITCTSTTTVDPPSSDCCLGNSCGKTSNPLAGNYEIPMQNFNFNYTMPQNSRAEVLIGYQNCTSGSARLDVTDDQLGNGVKGYSSTRGMRNIGVYGIGVTPVDGETGRTAIGVLGETNAVDKNGYAAGVAGFARGTSVLTALPPGEDIGVYGNSTANNGKWAGYFDGDVNITGNLWNNSTFIFSDKRYKKDIVTLENISEKLQKINGYSYAFRKDEFKEKNFDDKKHIGFIAQELKEVFPELVRENSRGYYAVDYQGMIPVLLEGIKEQTEQNLAQQKQIDELKALVKSLAAGASPDAKSGQVSAVPVTLSDKNVVVLNQNVPNPFAESTVISYNVPSDFAKAQIIFTTESGSVIKTIDIKEKGQGTLNVFANDLSHGFYSYTLVIDGKVIDTKKMIKE